MLKTLQKIKILSINVPQKSRGNKKKNDLPLGRIYRCGSPNNYDTLI